MCTNRHWEIDAQFGTFPNDDDCWGPYLLSWVFLDIADLPGTFGSTLLDRGNHRDRTGVVIKLAQFLSNCELKFVPNTWNEFSEKEFGLRRKVTKGDVQIDR